jgi:hypothetical protein
MSTKPLVQCFSDEIDAVIEKYFETGLTVSEAVGALELLKLNLWRDQTEEGDDE